MIVLIVIVLQLKIYKMLVNISYTYTGFLEGVLDIPDDKIEEFKKEIKERNMDEDDAYDYFHNNVMESEWLTKLHKGSQNRDFDEVLLDDSFLYDLVKEVRDSENCPECGRNRFEGNNFCSNCGTKLTK